MNAFERKFHEMVTNFDFLARYSTGELAMEIAHRLPTGAALRITNKGVRVTHSHYIDKLKSAQEVDVALLRNEFGY